MSSPIKLKQKLSPSAAKKKADRDLAYATGRTWNGKDTSVFKRSEKKADSQMKHRNSPANKNMDYDHKTSTFKSVKSNRGNDGKGTKIEGKSSYRIKTK